MKIVDLVPCVRKEKLNTRTHTYPKGHYAYPDGAVVTTIYNSEAEKKQFLKQGYFHEVDIHSQYRSWLLNNIEKDVVVAYIKDKFTTLMIIKCIGNRFKFLTYIDSNALQIYGYSVFKFNVGSLEMGLKTMEENSEDLKIVDEEEFTKCKRLLILKGLENE